jgi:hypothetical protein
MGASTLSLFRFLLSLAHKYLKNILRAESPRSKKSALTVILLIFLDRRESTRKEAGREKAQGVLHLDSAPPRHGRDDSGPVFSRPPSRLGGTAVSDFGGKFRRTFRSGLRNPSERTPGYSLLPHLYQDALKITPRRANGQS